MTCFDVGVVHFGNEIQVGNHLDSNHDTCFKTDTSRILIDEVIIVESVHHTVIEGHLGTNAKFLLLWCRTFVCFLRVV